MRTKNDEQGISIIFGGTHDMRALGNAGDALFAHPDHLTGLMTRHIFQQKVATDLAMVAQGVLLWLDIDHFMEINENHGLAVGDRVLQTLAARLQRVAGPSMLGACP